MRKRDPRWLTASERARVAAELIEEAESLTRTGGIATPAEVSRDQRVPPVRMATPAVSGDPSTQSPPPPPMPLTPAPVPPEVIARKAAARRDWDGALAALDMALGSAPDDTGLRLERASILSSISRFAAARRDLEFVLERDPAHVDALTALGVVLSRKGLWVDALPHLKRAVELEPGRPGVWYQLGESLNHLDDLSGARAAYERAVELDPAHSRALYGLGIVLDRMNRPQDATHMYRRSREAASR